ncbi:ROK family transcriptional regulator [Streptomyces sp. bgisy031]|uniref:ROK family transcriptional regulator n=1 Tax=Streptomyces sp. bgisy031 TaxID=3413772 RepID=UPI003D70A2A6
MANPASAGLIRAINDRAALDLLVERGPLSRAQLVAATGLSKQTVAELIDRLITAGLVREAGEGGHGTRGPSARVYGVAAEAAYVVGAEVKGTAVNASVADIAGRIVAETTARAEPGGTSVELVRTTLAQAVAEAGVERGRLHAAVLGTPGMVDPRTGDIGFAWDLPAWHTGLPDQLKDDLGCQVVLENEVNLSAVAEHRIGAAQDRENFALLALGYGAGMASFLGGRLHRGEMGGAGEIGHLPLPESPAGPLPEPGQLYTGGYQGLVGGRALIELAQRHGLPSGSAVEAIEAAPDDGGFLGELARRIALGVTSVCAVLDPGVIVLTGSVGRAAGERIAAQIEEAAARTSPLRVEIRSSSVPGNPVLAGAVLTALDRTRDAVFGP